MNQISELRRELERFKAELESAELSKSAVDTYVKGADTFIRWLAGDYTPPGPRTRK
jgi:hypothetical protein